MTQPSQYTPLDRFDNRANLYTLKQVAQYNQANFDFPKARNTEKRLLLERLKLEPGISCYDVGAGGGYLSEGIFKELDGNCRIVCVENSKSFMDSIDSRFERKLSSLTQLDLPDSSFDRVSCLAGLHHQEQKLAFFHEAFRILRPGGHIVVADVLNGSPPARFLNISVDQFNDLGHDGIFLEHGEFSQLMQSAGFIDGDESYEEFTWNLPDRPTLVSFCKTLFRMRRASIAQVSDEIDHYLKVTTSNEGAHLQWSLIYASGTKPI